MTVVSLTAEGSTIDVFQTLVISKWQKELNRLRRSLAVSLTLRDEILVSKMKTEIHSPTASDRDDVKKRYEKHYDKTVYGTGLFRVICA